MNGPHRPCTYMMGVVGDRCRYWGEERRKKSTVVGDQRDKQEWKMWTALRRRYASPENSSVSCDFGLSCKIKSVKKKKNQINFKWISLKSLWNKTCKIKFPFPFFCFVLLFCVVLFLFFVLLLFWSLVCFVASDFLTTICDLAIVNVCVIII